MAKATAVNAFELVPQAAHILVVDDELRQRSSLAELIALRGYRVDTACNGADALIQLQDHKIDLVLLDIRMPGLDGHAVLRRIREAQADVAVIAVSGDPTTEDATRALKAGADDYLRKPYAPEQIYTAIDNSLGKRALASQNQKIRRRLEQSERLHRLIVNQSPDLMIILDANHCFRFINQAADFVLGYAPDALVGQPFETLLEASDHRRARELVTLDPDRPELRSAEMRLRPRRSDIPARTFELLAMPLAFQNVSVRLAGDAEARSGGAYIVARDISDRLRSEALVRENEQRFRDFSQIAADCLWETDAQGRFQMVSDSFSRCFAMPAGGMVGLDMFEALRGMLGNTPDLWRLQQAVSEGVPFEIEFAELGPRHPACSVIFSGKPFFSLDGEIAGYRGVGRDVSEVRRKDRELRLHRERMEALVRQRTHDLEVVNRELESFSASVSHDLRTPLRAISGFGSLLLQDHSAALDSRGQGHLQRILRATDKMSELIDDLLGLSRVTRRTLMRESIDLGELAAEVDAGLREAEPGRRVTFECSRSMRIEADPNLLRIAIHNLLENAWKYSRPRDTARISLTERRIDGRRVFVVHDNGVGFDPRYASKLFGPFERLHSDERFEGSGIGLATVARIIHRHGGRIWADGRPDDGASFFFTLPGQGEALSLAGRDPYRSSPPSPDEAGE